MDVHFAVCFQIQTLRHAHARRVAGSSQKWQEGIGVALTTSHPIRSNLLISRLEKLKTGL